MADDTAVAEAAGTAAVAACVGCSVADVDTDVVSYVASLIHTAVSGDGGDDGGDGLSGDVDDDTRETAASMLEGLGVGDDAVHSVVDAIVDAIKDPAAAAAAATAVAAAAATAADTTADASAAGAAGASSSGAVVPAPAAADPPAPPPTANSSSISPNDTAGAPLAVDSGEGAVDSAVDGEGEGEDEGGSDALSELPPAVLAFLADLDGDSGDADATATALGLAEEVFFDFDEPEFVTSLLAGVELAPRPKAVLPVRPGDEGGGVDAAAGGASGLVRTGFGFAPVGDDSATTSCRSGGGGGASSRQPVCRHFVMGSCLRADCPFLHDTTTVVCKFWLGGSCTRGDGCAFAHEMPPDDDDDGLRYGEGSGGGGGGFDGAGLWVPGASNGAMAPETAAAAVADADPFVADEASFPALGGGSSESGVGGARGDGDGSSHPGSGAAGAGASGSDTDGALVSALAAACPWADVSDIRAAVASCGGGARDGGGGGGSGAGSDDATPPKALVSRLKREVAARYAGQLFTHRPRAGAARDSGATTITGGTSGGSQSSASLRDAPAAASVEWVTTGAAVNALYTRLRADAIEAAVARNRCFQLAADAYRRGDGAAARSLSASGRRYDRQMRDLHSQAGQAIFRARNAQWQRLSKAGGSGSGSGGGGDTSTIDLHGLHKGEAVGVLEASLADASARGLRWLCVIAGAGHHARLGRAKVLPAVRAYLREAGFEFSERSTDGRGGTLVVRVQ